MAEPTSEKRAILDDSRAQHDLEEWCSRNFFKIGAQQSEHIYELDKIARAPQIDRGARIYPYERADCAFDSRDGHEVLRAESSAEAIFRAVTLSPSATPREPCTSLDQCAICTQLLGKKRAHPCTQQFLILCPDAVLAHCARDVRDIIDQYVVVLYLNIAPPILNTIGSWTFEMIQRMRIDAHTYEGFVAFRTFIICNVARLRIQQSREPQNRESRDSRSRFAIFARFRANPQAQQSANVFIIRHKMDNGIRFTRSSAIADELIALTNPAIFTPEIAREYENAAHAIFDLEPTRNFTSAILDPSASPVPIPGVFNYWRGWNHSIREHSENGAQPFVSAITDILCVADSHRAPGAIFSDLAHFAISWFATIIQEPANLQEHRAIIVRGFPTTFAESFLQFIGNKVIGAQYYEHFAAIDVPLRPDCLLISLRVSRDDSDSREISTFCSALSATHPITRIIIHAPNPSSKVLQYDIANRGIAIPRVRFARFECATSVARDSELIDAENAARDTFSYLAQFSPIARYWH